MFQLNLFFGNFLTNKVMLNIHMLYTKIINKIFRECLNFLIIAINNDNDEIINKFESFINYENVVDIDEHVKCVQFIK